MENSIRFRILDKSERGNSPYKYELSEVYTHKTFRKFPSVDFISAGIPWIRIHDGVLTIKGRYRWDGATGATDTAEWLQASLVHDALYQIIREGLLPPRYRVEADSEMRDLLKKAGMSWFHRNKFWVAIRIFGKVAACPKKTSRP